ncbi:alpha/beta hydrolase family protein [Marilutibacter alkalisoli]|uniref:S9 family peptidase n=1 Tax=Marilutibacter alkalisoli TaxID=2591633 RepID=A0A514BV83_9GAMM|nr:S9 family peptidase [Lysobacter alkalisoli]QDH71304.1 S9 family peptidase [Lysobacter alkalisoli]
MRWLLACACLCLSMQVCAGVDLDAFLKRDTFGTIKISPDGRYYAATVPMGDRTGMVIVDREAKRFVSKATGGRKSTVANFWWVDDARVVIAMAETEGSKDTPYLTGQLHMFDIEGGSVRNVFGVRIEPGMTARIGGPPSDMATLVDPLIDSADEILIAVWQPSSTPQTRVERLNLKSRRTRRVASAPVGRADFTVDARGQVRFADGADSRNYRRLYYRAGDKADWQLVSAQEERGEVVSALGLSADGGTAWLRVKRPDGPDRIEAMDTASLERKPLLRDERVDPYKILYDRDGRTPIGVQYMDDGVHSRFFDETSEMARSYRALEKAFPGSAVDFTSFTRDGKLALMQVWNDRTAGDYALFDMQARTADGVFESRKWLAPTALPRSERIELQARDGVRLNGYLTRPQGWTRGASPMVVMPHGGPFGIFDEWGYDTDTQILAAAGYAVLRVNYRGSGNYGLEFKQLGAQQWGGTMQDDLTDATRWAVGQGIADGGRICIFGGSYGGYAALMGVAREPALYRCAVGYVGVYDLELMHREDSRQAAWLRHWANDWVGERNTLAERSPVNLAGSIKAPVFLAAGGDDHRAPIAHSKRMEKALRKADVPVETLYYDSEGHGFVDDGHRREFYTRLLDFLARHLGGERAEDQ